MDERFAENEYESRLGEGCDAGFTEFAKPEPEVDSETESFDKSSKTTRKESKMSRTFNYHKRFFLQKFALALTFNIK